MVKSSTGIPTTRDNTAKQGTLCLGRVIARRRKSDIWRVHPSNMRHLGEVRLEHSALLAMMDGPYRTSVFEKPRITAPRPWTVDTVGRVRIYRSRLGGDEDVVGSDGVWGRLPRKGVFRTYCV